MLSPWQPDSSATRCPGVGVGGPDPLPGPALTSSLGWCTSLLLGLPFLGNFLGSFLSGPCVLILGQERARARRGLPQEHPLGRPGAGGTLTGANGLAQEGLDVLGDDAEHLDH